jgi:hypothetical protein
MDTIVARKDVIPFRWADEIFVAQQGDDLLVWGDRNMWKSADLLFAYEREPVPPHIQFANCKTDADIISFVEKFGPVNGTQLTMPGSPVGTVEQRGIVQNLGELRTERTLLRTAIALMTRLVVADRADAGTEAIDDLVALLKTLPDGTRGWVAQVEREQAELHGGEYGQIQWHWSPADQCYLEELAMSASDAASRRGSPRYAFSAAQLLPDPLSLSRNALVLLLNAFPLSLRWYGDAPIEVPSYEMLHGIRPLLFAMLRRDLIRKRQVRMCNHAGCGNYFVASRIDRGCCTPKCSIAIVSNRYYEGTRKPAREKARKAREKAQKRALQVGAAAARKRKGRRRSATASMHLGGSE